MSDRWTDLLSDHLDGDLAASQRSALEAHLEMCEECRVTLEELRRVKAAARVLVGPSVPDDLWAGIASQIGTTGASSTRGPQARILSLPRRHSGFAKVRWAVAAGIALLLVAAGAVYVLRPALFGGHATPTIAQGVVPGSLGPESTAALQLAAFDPVQVEGEISQLKRALDRGRGKLDPKTVRVLETNLNIIQKAAEDAKAALAKDPANRDLRDYFATSVGRKLAFMKRATQLAGV